MGFSRLCHHLAVTLFVAAIALISARALAETRIAFLRHGEKPAAGLGQLDCRGLNRALALPAVLKRKFADIALIVAPDPGHLKHDHGRAYYYVRPLMTIEPTAVTLGLSVDTSLSFDDAAGLVNYVDHHLAPSGTNRTILVVWEHHIAENAVRHLLRKHHSTTPVPPWRDADFDSIYTVTVANNGTAQFALDQENLTALPDRCPGE